MILQGGDKTQQLYDDGDRVYMIYLGEDLVYNCYCKLRTKSVVIDSSGQSVAMGIKTNTDWSIQ